MRGVFSAMALLGASACTHASPALPEGNRIVFTQTLGRRTNPPHYEQDLEIPPGRERWVLALRCQDQGRPCPHASVDVHLRFATSTPAGGLRAALVPASRSRVTLDRFEHCWETMFQEVPPNQCTFRITSGWEATRRVRD